MLASRIEDILLADPPSPIAARLARLPAGQRQCLLLVDQHLSSKEIALRLGISSHTVNQRIRQALHVLGVERRGEAARMIAAGAPEAGPDSAEPYQRLIHQPPHIDVAPEPAHQEGAVSHQIRHADRAREASSAGEYSEQNPAGHWSPLPMPFSTRSHPRNEMSVGFRLLWIVLIAIGAAFAAGMYLAGLESLSRMVSQ